jgi:hypothetical protein
MLARGERTRRSEVLRLKQLSLQRSQEKVIIREVFDQAPKEKNISRSKATRTTESASHSSPNRFIFITPTTFSRSAQK